MVTSCCIALALVVGCRERIVGAPLVIVMSKGRKVIIGMVGGTRKL